MTYSWQNLKSVQSEKQHNKLYKNRKYGKWWWKYSEQSVLKYMHETNI